MYRWHTGTATASQQSTRQTTGGGGGRGQRSNTEHFNVQSAISAPDMPARHSRIIRIAARHSPHESQEPQRARPFCRRQRSRRVGDGPRERGRAWPPPSLRGGWLRARATPDPEACSAVGGLGPLGAAPLPPPDGQMRGDGVDRRLERNTRAVDNTRQLVAPKLVGAHWMLGALGL